MNAPAQYTKETQQLTTTNAGYNQDYNSGYNAGFLANRVSPTVRVNYHDIVGELDNDTLWAKRASSVQYIFGIVIIAIISLSAVIGWVSFLIQTIISAGINTYMMIAPLVLAVIIGYWYRGKK